MATTEPKVFATLEEFIASLTPDEQLMMKVNPKGGTDQLNHRLRKRALREKREKANGEGKDS